MSEVKPSTVALQITMATNVQYTRCGLLSSASVGGRHLSEEIGHIFCPRDYALRLNGNNCVFYVPNLASLVPKSIWPGTEGKRKLPTRSEATVGEFER